MEVSLRMIALIDYDTGNLRSVSKAIEKLGAEVQITRDADTIKSASHVILPGVGAFKDCMAKLEEYNLTDVIKDVIASGTPFLGICVGLQLLFEKSSEFGSTNGLGILKGEVVRFDEPSSENHTHEFKVPHMGWNSIEIKKDSKLFKGISDGEFFYFVHSYFVKDAESSNILSTTNYGVDFISSIEVGNLFGCQFHPEKSQTLGLKVLENFINIK